MKSFSELYSNQYKQFMGNKFMRKQTTFKHLVENTPKLKPTSIPRPSSQNHKQACSILDSKVKDTDKFPLYHFGSKKKLEEHQAYQLPEAISLLTYNIWFQSHNKDIRYQCILKILELSNADFICLQEVTSQFVNLLHALPQKGWVGNYYTGVIPMGWYDTLILSKYKCNFYKIPFPSSLMGRSMLFAELLEAKGQNIVVGCVHYESLDGNQDIRKQQIKSVQEITQQCDRVIIAGDFNFGDHYQENKIISKQYTDLWVKLRNLQQDRYTMPQTTKFPPWRTDHIVCKLPKEVDLSLAEINKVGQFTIPPFENDKISQIGHDNIVRTPSDHFGLISWVPLK